MRQQSLTTSIGSRSVNLIFLGVTLAAVSLMCACGTDRAGVDEVPDDVRASEFDRQMIMRTYELARSASREGNPPFGALLVHGDSVVAEATNTGKSTGDVIRHAETGLLSDASRRFGRDYLSECWLYSSTEPCVMCSGAIRWARIPRVVYGTPQNLGGHFNEIPCREILEEIAPGTEVIGPVLQEEGREIRAEFGRGGWKGRKNPSN